MVSKKTAEAYHFGCRKITTCVHDSAPQLGMTRCRDSQRHLLPLPSPSRFRRSGASAAAPFASPNFHTALKAARPALLLTSAPLSTVQFSPITISVFGKMSTGFQRHFCSYFVYRVIQRRLRPKPLAEQPDWKAFSARNHRVRRRRWSLGRARRRVRRSRRRQS